MNIDYFCLYSFYIILRRVSAQAPKVGSIDVLAPSPKIINLIAPPKKIKILPLV